MRLNEDWLAVWLGLLVTTADLAAELYGFGSTDDLCRR
jgi:hypothetical protein